MQVQQIYSQRKTPPGLQEHMLRVAAVAQVILNHWTGPTINKEAIITTCLFHDIAKPLTFDMSKQEQFVNSDEELQALQEHHDDLISRYGIEEHPALLKIFSELNLSEDACRLVDNLEWHYIPRLLKVNDIESLIPIYCDMRVGPRGVLSMEDRIENLLTRAQVDNLEELILSGKELERLLSQNVSIDLNSIDDLQIASVMEELQLREL